MVDDSFKEHRTGQPSAVQQSFLPANILQEIQSFSRDQLVSSPTLGGEILSDSTSRIRAALIIAQRSGNSSL